MNLFHCQNNTHRHILFDVYKDSLFAEIKRRSDLDYHILMRADWKVADDDSLLLTLEDSLWARNRAGELREWIQMVFYDRCANINSCSSII